LYRSSGLFQKLAIFVVVSKARCSHPGESKLIRRIAMSILRNAKLLDSRYLLAGPLVLLLLVAFPLAAAAGSVDGSSYSGDDAYDPAAGGFPELYASVAASFSGDDAYDLAAGAIPERGALIFAAGFSGDDAYDAAAGGLEAVSLFSVADAMGGLAFELALACVPPISG
jgi:hypothetical protein